MLNLYLNIYCLQLSERYMIKWHHPEEKAMLQDPVGHYLFQLRLSLNHLRCNKKHRFIDAPSDICLRMQGSEDTHHILLSFPIYTTKRVASMDSVNLNHPAYFPLHELKVYLYVLPTIIHSANSLNFMSTKGWFPIPIPLSLRCL